MIATLFLALTMKRALWMWHGGPLLTSAPARKYFFNFIHAPKGDPNHAISVVFLSEVDPSNASTMPALSSLIQQCHSKGVRVDYLCGESEWARPEKNSIGLAQIDEVLKYNQSQPKQRRFDGFQFDVEPYLMPDWPTAALRAGYLKLFESSEEHIKAADSHLLLGAAIPRWYGNSDMNSLHKEVLDRVDYVAVMDYVSTSEQFVKDPTAIVNYATQSGKQAWLGAEATELPTEPMATFYAKGNAAMENAFAAAQKAYSSDSGFAGVCVEYYETYVALRP